MRAAVHPKHLLVHLILFQLLTIFISGQSIPGTDNSGNIQRHADLARRFKAGDTNLPMLEMTWYNGGTFAVRIEKTGEIGSGHFGFSNYYTVRSPLDSPNPQILRGRVLTIMKELPPGPTEVLPDRRQILISGTRSNQWFHAVYDRMNIPAAVSNLFDLVAPQINPAKLDPLPRSGTK